MTYRYSAFNMDRLKIVKGNTFDTRIEIKAYTYSGQEILNFDLNNCTDIVVNARVKGKIKNIKNFIIEDAKHMIVTWKANSQDLGAYSLEVTGKYSNAEWRFYDKTPIFEIVLTNNEAHIPAQSIIRENYYSVEVRNLQLLSYTTTSSDLSGLARVATTGSYTDLINKPTIPTVPSNVSAFTKI